jgi:hypothetical protein
VQVWSRDIVGIFGGAVTGSAEIADDITGLNDAADLQSFIIREILAKMSIIIIPLPIKAADTDPPAAVLVPAESLHITGLHGNDRGADLAHHIMSEMLPLEAIASGYPKIIEVAVGIILGDRKISLKTIFLLPLLAPRVGFVRHLNFIFTDHTAEDSGIGLQIIFIMFHVRRNRFHSDVLRFQLIHQIGHILFFISREISSIFCPKICQKLDPVHMDFLVIGFHIITISPVKSLITNIKADPFNKIFLFIIH